MLWALLLCATAMRLRSIFSTDTSKASAGPACQCEATNHTWKLSTRTVPTCVFFDLGAGDGETFRAFQHKSAKWSFDYNTTPFEKSQCTSYLVEANPRFNPDLQQCSTTEAPGHVQVLGQTAVYMCDKAHEKFFLDTKGTGWGSSLDEKHPDVKGKLQPVDVKVVNLMRLLAENAIDGDTVAVKMDIEGAEWDILPCLATSPFARLIDYLYLENHCPGGNVTQGQWCASKGQANNTKVQFDAALHALLQAGVQMPQYFSPMLLQMTDLS
eukprot:GEMP01050962.1.p1 GENE.GEMP01050962.1~~GEMP01050962.1.p1  ORF type:complete len:269 (+),score=65.56 GEMP01050962.1:72-878(+)